MQISTTEYIQGNRTINNSPQLFARSLASPATWKGIARMPKKWDLFSLLKRFDENTGLPTTIGDWYIKELPPIYGIFLANIKKT
jgi:hypothetical protein